MMTNAPDSPAGLAEQASRSAPAVAFEGDPADPATVADATTSPPLRLTEPGMKRFLDELAEIGSVFEAARRSRTPRGALYRRRARDPAFAAAWDEAIQLAVDRLQDEAMVRAIEGVERPVFYRGDEVATVRQISDRLLMFLLRAHRRELYDPRYVRPWKSRAEQVAAEEAEAAQAARRWARAKEYLISQSLGAGEGLARPGRKRAAP